MPDTKLGNWKKYWETDRIKKHKNIAEGALCIGNEMALMIGNSGLIPVSKQGVTVLCQPQTKLKSLGLMHLS